MAEQELKERLAEQGIALEPATIPGKRVSSLIQRGWSLLFGRKGAFLYPARVERLGGLMVMPFDGLVAPDHVNSKRLDSTTTQQQWNFTTAAPRISEIKMAQALTASPYTLAAIAMIIVYDGVVATENITGYVPGGCHTIWVHTVSQYLSVFNPSGLAIHIDVGVRSWDL